MEGKRQRISDLLSAQIGIKKIMEIIGCSSALVYKVKNLKENNMGLARRPGSGGHNKKRTELFLTGLLSEIMVDPTQSMRKLGKELGVSKTTIRNAVGDLGLFSYVRRRRQLLSEKTKEMRVLKGKRLLSWMKKHDRSTIRIFSDKKLWTVDQSRNSRNDRYLAFCVEEVPPINVTKHPASAMMLGVVASNGKRMPPYWFPKGL